MAKIRMISVLAWTKFEQERKANGLSEDQFLRTLLGIKEIPPIKEEETSNVDPEVVIHIAEPPKKKKKKLSHREKLEAELNRLKENEKVE